MKKRWVVLTMAAMLAASCPAVAFAANSITTGAAIGDSSSSSTKEKDGMEIPSGQTMTNPVTGEQSTVSQNERGQAVVGNTALEFAKDSAATAGLPEAVVSAINDINAGKSLSDVISGVDLVGYNALTSTHAIVTRDNATNAVKVGNVDVPIYVPNLVENLGNVEILFYDNATGLWQKLPVTVLDVANKTVWANIPGSGTFSVVYKK